MDATRIASAAWLALAALAVAPLQAAVTGTCERDGRQLSLVDGVAWVIENEYLESGETAWQLAFSSHPLDSGRIWREAPSRRESAFTFQVMEATGDAGTLQLELLRRDSREADEEFDAREAEDLVRSQSLWLSPGTTLSRSGSTVGEVRVRQHDAARIRGHYRFAEDDLRCSVDFDIPVLGDPSTAPPPPGEPLPADGGEPGKVVLVSNRALLAGDIETLATVLHPER